MDLYVQSSERAGLPFGFYLTWVRLKSNAEVVETHTTPCSTKLLWMVQRPSVDPPFLQNYNYLFNYGPQGFAQDPLQPGQVRPHGWYPWCRQGVRWSNPVALRALISGPWQVNVTLPEYLAIATAAIREVWSRYPGKIYEVRDLGKCPALRCSAPVRCAPAYRSGSTAESTTQVC